MPLITDEQSVKQPSEFLKLDKENSVVLLSNVYAIKSHYLQGLKKAVACIGLKNGCVYCKKESPRGEYYYFALVNKDRGILRVPAGVFFSMNKLEKVMKNGKTKRDYSWIILKEGEGLETKYTCSKDEAISQEEIANEDIDKNNEILAKKLESYEKRLTENYKQYSKSISSEPELTEPDELPEEPDNIDEKDLLS